MIWVLSMLSWAFCWDTMINWISVLHWWGDCALLLHLPFVWNHQLIYVLATSLAISNQHKLILQIRLEDKHNPSNKLCFCPKGKTFSHLPKETNVMCEDQVQYVSWFVLWVSVENVLDVMVLDPRILLKHLFQQKNLSEKSLFSKKKVSLFPSPG